MWRPQGTANQISTRKNAIVAAKRAAAENNVPETIVVCFKYEREALKLEKEVEALEKEQNTRAARLWAVDSVLGWLLPLLPWMLYGNMPVFELGAGCSGLLWPVGWLLAPTGGSGEAAAVGLFPWTCLCVFATRHAISPF